MTPQEIRSLLQQSPELCEAFNAERAHMWHFLRDEVASLHAVTICVECGENGILLETPYRPDLCIPCLLAFMEQLKDDPIIDKYRDPRSRDYDPDYAASCKFWEEFYSPALPDDYDGPPIWIA